MKPPLLEAPNTSPTNSSFLPQNIISAQLDIFAMASNSLPNQVKIAIKRRKLPTNSSPIPTASHKKIKKSIANVKLEFGHILDIPVLKQKSPKNKTKSPSSNLPFILPPLKKSTLKPSILELSGQRLGSHVQLGRTMQALYHLTLHWPNSVITM
jgi:hypothetical protein